MPRVSIRVERTVDRVGESAVSRSALTVVGTVINCLADERMPEADRWPEADEIGGFGFLGRVFVEVECQSRAPQQRGIARWFGGRGQEQSLRRRRKRAHLPQEPRFQLTVE